MPAPGLMAMNYCIKTYGCQMNVRDSEAVSAALSRHGLIRVDDEDEADVIIVNTCSVRGKAEDKALGKLGLMVATKRQRPDRIVGAMGCMVQNLGATLLTRVPGLDFGAGTRRFSRVPALIEFVREGRGPVLDYATDDPGWDDLDGHEETGSSAFVNILFGCNRRCSYCIVPSVRGDEWSRSAEQVLAEVGALADRGVKEVTLLGQSVMSYGRRNEVWHGGRPSPRNFTEPLTRLLEAVADTPGIRRVRFTSGHPSGCTPELARAMAGIPGLCDHLHLPVQSGSDRILGLMRRGYTADGYREAVTRLRDAVPGLALTTDVIVGFPSETEAEFEDTRVFMDEIGFDQSFIFKYSPRRGTPAAEMPDDVPDDEKARRNQVLLEDQDRRSMRINDRLMGQTVEVLAEGESTRDAARWSGRTTTNRIVIFEPAGELRPGDEVSVLIERATPQTLFGRLVPPGNQETMT